MTPSSDGRLCGDGREHEVNGAAVNQNGVILPSADENAYTAYSQRSAVIE